MGLRRRLPLMVAATGNAAVPPTPVGEYDGIANLVHVYEPARCTLTAYDGTELVRLRRASDDAEANFTNVSTANQELDLAAIAAWAGGASYIVTIFDQAGAADVTQATDANQPLFTANAQNGHAGTTFDGTDDFLAMLTPAGFLADDAKTFMMMFKGRSVGLYDFAMATRVDFGGVNNNAKGYLSLCDTRTGYNHVGAGDTIVDPALTQTNPYVVGFIISALGANVDHYVNSALQVLTTDTIGNAVDELANGYTVIGRQSSAYSGGHCCSVLLFDAAITATPRQAAETALNAYWEAY